MIYGTSHFVSMESAVTYYRAYGFSRADVAGKITAGEIHIGKPELGPGERLSLLDDGTRYGIEDSPEVERIDADAWDGEPDLEGASSTEAGRYAAKAAGKMLGPKP